MFTFPTLIRDVSDILRPVALRVWPNNIPTENKQSRSEALRFKRVLEVTVGSLI